MTATPDVRLVGVTKQFDDVVAVDDLSVEVESGSFFALLGPSGCGKTTTLRMIGGFEQPTAGEIYLGEREVASLPAYKRDVNTVFQSYALFPHLSVFENVGFGLRRKAVRGDMLRGRVDEMLKIVGLEGMGRRKPRQLSGGQQQRVALARALVMEPAVLLLDEPLGALDLRLRRQMQLVLKQVQARVGITFLYVTHDQEEAFAMSDRVGVMGAGVLEQVGPPQDIYRRPASLFVADFVGASNRLAATVRDGEPGGYLVELDGSGDRLLAPGTADLEPGDGAAVVVRPEALSLDGDGPATLFGRLVDASFLGSQTVYTLDVPGSGNVIVAETRPRAAMPSPGDELRVSFDPAEAWVVSAAA